MKKRTFLVAAAVALAAVVAASRWRSAPATARSPAGVSKADVDPIVRRLIDEDYAGAVVVGIVDGQGPRLFGYGSLSADHTVVPDGKTVFPIGCLTEAFTGSLLADMAHRGEVKPDAPAGPLLPPGVVLPAAGRDRFTLARIASHWSLLPPSGRVDPDGGYKTVRQYTTEQMYTALSRWHFRPTSPNTEIHDISDFGTALLGHLLVRAGGEADYEQLLLKRFCSPLDLRDTRVTPSDDMRRRLAPPHDVDGAPTTSLPPAKTYASYDGIYSTADDLLRFIGASLGTGAPAGQLGVALKENLSRTATANGGQINTGYGWRLSTKDYVDRYYQGGPNAGYYAMAVVQPDQHWGLVLLTDRSIDDEVVSEVLVGLVARMSGKPARPPALLKSQKGPVPNPDDYVGRYDLGYGGTYIVTRDGDQLAIEGTSGMPKQRLCLGVDGEFFVKTRRVKFAFQRDKGKVTGLTLRMLGQDVRGVKTQP
jgi:CubicO group peptidase (beta-lactamase class C family)